MSAQITVESPSNRGQTLFQLSPLLLVGFGFSGFLAGCFISLCLFEREAVSKLLRPLAHFPSRRIGRTVTSLAISA